MQHTSTASPHSTHLNWTMTAHIETDDVMYIHTKPAKSGNAVQCYMFSLQLRSSTSTGCPPRSRHHSMYVCVCVQYGVGLYPLMDCCYIKCQLSHRMQSASLHPRMTWVEGSCQVSNEDSEGKFTELDCMEKWWLFTTNFTPREELFFSWWWFYEYSVHIWCPIRSLRLLFR